MVKWCFNYESGDYEYIEKDGFSIDLSLIHISEPTRP